MEIILEKDGELEYFSFKYAFYCLWLAFIPVFAIVIAIYKHQFKGLIMNLVAVYTGIGILYMIMINISLLAGVIVQVIALIMYFYYIIIYTLNINKYTIASRIAAGYTVKNIDEPGVREVIADCMQTNYPLVQLTKF